MARCRNDSFDGASPATCRPAGSSLDRRAGSSRPSEALVGVNSQPPSTRTLMLPLLPAVSPRSKRERPISQISSRRRFSSACATDGGAHGSRLQALKKKSGVPKFPDFRASASGRPPSLGSVAVHGTPGSISGRIRRPLTLRAWTTAPEVSPPATIICPTPSRTKPCAMAASAFSTSSPARPTPRLACAAFTSSGVAVA